ncbi:hypothetical protein EX30DRAFT_372550 [Ascodesmis nigricans]|uniref:Nuclear segregation protein n=1 Tax=Ascodesmis nigricans TaxID=341454 RepID=A0A4S2MU71_9PEZI|nr:hypothetical protein EX30DRAFT_372550 [Ascodesmis nigricans]
MSSATTTAAAAAAPVVEKKQAPKKPDEEEFKKALAAQQKEHDAIKAKLTDVRAKLDSTKPGGRDPRQQELRDQMNQIKTQVASKKSVSQKLHDQIKTLQDSINARGKDLTSKQKAMPYRTLADLERQIAELDRKVNTGMMKIVDEKKALQEISTLNKQKKNFAVFEEAQKAIDADKQKLKELKEKKQDPELVELNKKFDELQKELNKLRDEQHEHSKNVNTLRDERTKLQKEQNEKWEEIKALKDTYYQGIREYREYTAAARKAREERYKKQREEEQLARNKKYAAEKLEEASAPAFSSEIITCNSLLTYFDPSHAVDASSKSLLTPSNLAATAQRTVDSSLLKGKKLVKEEESYFIGNPKKSKGKKNKKPAGAETEDAASVAPHGKINLNVGLIEQLGQIGVKAPSSQEEVKETIEAIGKKLEWYKENQKRVTEENIAKAKKELEKFEAEGSDVEEKVEAKEEKSAVVEEKKEAAPATEETPAAEAEEKKEE